MRIFRSYEKFATHFPFLTMNSEKKEEVLEVLLAVVRSLKRTLRRSGFKFLTNKLCGFTEAMWQVT